MRESRGRRGGTSGASCLGTANPTFRPVRPPTIMQCCSCSFGQARQVTEGGSREEVCEDPGHGTAAPHADVGLACPALASVGGTVVAWGGNAYGQSTVPGGLSGVTAIAAGLDHSLALMSDGTVVAWGGNDDGQAPPRWPGDVSAIAAGTSTASP